jgi:microcystin-dependent protein
MIGYICLGIVILAVLIVLIILYTKEKFLLSIDKDGNLGTMPIGTILPWLPSGKADPPSGWYLCDGSNGTPNLTGKTLIGEGDNYVFKQTGGSPTVQLSTDNLPAHDHIQQAWLYKSSIPEKGKDGNMVIGGKYDNAKLGSYNTTEQTGASKSFNIMQPYYVVKYIIYLGST